MSSGFKSSIGRPLGDIKPPMKNFLMRDRKVKNTGNKKAARP
jgi:hypothetical protein